MLAGRFYKALLNGTQSYFSELKILEILQVGLILTMDNAIVLCGSQAQNSCAEKLV